MPTIETTAVQIAAGGLIQNLGPDAVYIGETDDPAETGIKVDVDVSMAIGYSNGSLYAVSDGESDVRVLGRATGLFSTPSA